MFEKQGDKRIYIAIDLKSFYASVECTERGLDALTTNLVVADVSRTEKTICLAVSPSLKAYGIPGRARLFEVVQAVESINAQRRISAPRRRFSGKSVNSIELATDKGLELDYIAAPPQMAKYIEVSSKIYDIYLRYISSEDIHVYSIDEVFMDVTDYLKTYKMTAHELAMRMIQDVLKETGITATAGIGTNLYLCKVAMDIVAKHIPADEDGVRIAQLDEMSYRKLLWAHTPLTDFWRVGRGYAKKLNQNGIYTMGDIARCSLHNEELLYKMFGINAELLIDHAWGVETCTMKDIKNYKPMSSSVSIGQVLPCAYSWEKGRLIVKEMADLLALDLVDKGLVTDQVVLFVCYDIQGSENYEGALVGDYYGRRMPPPVNGSCNLGMYTSSSRSITKALCEIYDNTVDPTLMVRRVNVCAGRVKDESPDDMKTGPIQLDMFTDYEQIDKKLKEREVSLTREKNVQKAMLEIKKKFGKNAVLKGMNLEEGGTTRDRNNQIGGHRA